MSIDVSAKRNEASKYDKAIKGFGGLRDTLDRAVKILELIRAAEYLHMEDRAFLDEKLDDLKVRAEEIRIEKLKKPEYTPPASKPKKKGYVRASGDEILRRLEDANETCDAIIAKMEGREEVTSAIKLMYSPSPGLNTALASLNPLYSPSQGLNTSLSLLNPLTEVRTANPVTSADDKRLDVFWWRELKPIDVVYYKDVNYNHHILTVMSSSLHWIYLRDNNSGEYSLWHEEEIALYLAPSIDLLKLKAPMR
ncbi:MAG: hypothetical protein J6S14_15820 [Clostridia bacterium]|nr:hypothetical protein [Clostridia bacterium]